MRILFVRVSCQKEKNLWPRLRRHKFQQVIICGDPKLKTNYKLEDDVLYLKCRDGYDALPEKMIAAFNAILEIEEFKNVNRFLKLDSDNMLRSSCMVSRDQTILKYDYVGQRIWWLRNGDNPREYHFSRVSKDSYWYQRKYEGEMVPYVDGGCSYVLSRRALKLITKEYGFDKLEEVYKNHIYEDVMVGLLLKKHNITPHKTIYNISGDKKISIGLSNLR